MTCRYQVADVGTVPAVAQLIFGFSRIYFLYIHTDKSIYYMKANILRILCHLKRIQRNRHHLPSFYVLGETVAVYSTQEC